DAPYSPGRRWQTRRRGRLRTSTGMRCFAGGRGSPRKRWRQRATSKWRWTPSRMRSGSPRSTHSAGAVRCMRSSRRKADSITSSGTSRSGTMDASVRAEAHAFLEQVERQYESALAAIRDHPFVRGVAQGTVPLDTLRRFAHAEYWYMRGGVKHFALSLTAAPDL